MSRPSPVSTARASHAVQVLLERSARRLNVLEHARDLSELGRAAGRDDDPGGAPGRHRRAAEHHVGAIRDRGSGVFDRLRALVDGDGLPGQRGLVDLEVERLHETRVGSDPVTCGEEGHVPRNEFSGGHLDLVPSAKDPHTGGRHLAERLDRPLRPVFLHESEKNGEEHDDGDGDGLRTVAEHRRDPRSEEQEDDQDVLELREKRGPGRDAIGGRELVRAVLPESAGSFGGSQALG